MNRTHSDLFPLSSRRRRRPRHPSTALFKLAGVDSGPLSLCLSLYLSIYTRVVSDGLVLVECLSTMMMTTTTTTTAAVRSTVGWQL